MISDLCDPDTFSARKFTFHRITMSADFFQFRRLLETHVEVVFSLQEARHGAAFICCALDDAVGSAGATALAKARQNLGGFLGDCSDSFCNRFPSNLKWICRICMIWPQNISILSIVQYIEYIVNTYSNLFKHLKHHAFGISGCVSRLNLPDGQIQGLWECKAGPWECRKNRGNGNVRGSRHTVYDSDVIKTQVVLMFESCSNRVQIALGGQSLDRLSHSLRGMF